MIGILGAIVLATIFAAATKNHNTARHAANVVAFGIGAAYVITNLRKWKRNNEVVRGAGIGWTAAVFLVLIGLAEVMALGSGGRIGGTSSSTSSGAPTPRVDPPRPRVDPPTPRVDPPRPRVNPSDELLREVKLNTRWGKEGFGNVMVAEFTIKNPTQYRFKDFTIECTLFAPSGTTLDSNKKTIYEIVEPKSTKQIHEMNMGFINSQASRSRCEITDLNAIGW